MPRVLVVTDGLLIILDAIRSVRDVDMPHSTGQASGPVVRPTKVGTVEMTLPLQTVDVCDWIKYRY